jgi:predicted regulator of Ras-like GTPase activity (Roadblock/LC7/MglB family)
MMDDLNFLLDDLIRTVPHTKCAVLLSVDGIKTHWSGVGADDADILAAMASGMISLAHQVGAKFGGHQESGVRQVITELSGLYLFVTAAAGGTVLAVLTGREVNTGAISFEMAKLCKRVPTRIATPPRQSTATGSGIR